MNDHEAKKLLEKTASTLKKSRRNHKILAAIIYLVIGMWALDEEKTLYTAMSDIANRIMKEKR